MSFSQLRTIFNPLIPRRLRNQLIMMAIFYGHHPDRDHELCG